MSNIDKKIFDKYKLGNEKGGTLILMTVLILAAVTIVTITIGDIVRNGIIMTRERYHSTLAYYAAEAGAERMMWEILENSYDIHTWCDDGDAFPNTNEDIICFKNSDQEAFDDTPDLDSSCVYVSCDGDSTKNYILSNGAKYEINFKFEQGATEATTTIISTGAYETVGRRLELTY